MSNPLEIKVGINGAGVKAGISSIKSEFTGLKAEVGKQVELKIASQAAVNSIRQIKGELKDLIGQRDTMEIGSAGFEAASRKIDELFAKIKRAQSAPVKLNLDVDAAAAKAFPKVKLNLDVDAAMREFDKLNPAKGSIAAITMEAAKLDAELRKLPVGTAAFTQKAEQLKGVQAQLNGALKQGGVQGRNMGMALMMAAQTADDAQYGFRSIVNNIPMLLQSLGLGAGLAGAISLVAVLMNVLNEHTDLFGSKNKAAAADADRLTKAIEDMANAQRKAKEARVEGAAQSVVRAAKIEVEAYQAVNKELDRQIDKIKEKSNASIEAAKRQAEIALAQVDNDETSGKISKDEAVKRRSAINGRTAQISATEEIKALMAVMKQEENRHALAVATRSELQMLYDQQIAKVKQLEAAQQELNAVILRRQQIPNQIAALESSRPSDFVGPNQDPLDARRRIKQQQEADRAIFALKKEETAASARFDALQGQLKNGQLDENRSAAKETEDLLKKEVQNANDASVSLKTAGEKLRAGRENINAKAGDDAKVSGIKLDTDLKKNAQEITDAQKGLEEKNFQNSLESMTDAEKRAAIARRRDEKLRLAEQEADPLKKLGLLSEASDLNGSTGSSGGKSGSQLITTGIGRISGGLAYARDSGSDKVKAEVAKVVQGQKTMNGLLKQIKDKTGKAFWGK